MVLVDLLLHKEIQRYRWLPYATPFYPSIENIDIRVTLENNILTKEIEESNDACANINEK